MCTQDGQTVRLRQSLMLRMSLVVQPNCNCRGWLAGILWQSARAGIDATDELRSANQWIYWRITFYKLHIHRFSHRPATVHSGGYRLYPVSNGSISKNCYRHVLPPFRL